MDSGVAVSADHQGLATPFRHDCHPLGRCGLPRLAEVSEFANLVHLHLALCSQISHRPARSRPISSLRRTVTGTGSRSTGTVFFCRRSGMPPNRATSGFLPSPRSTLTWKHLRGPCGVWTVALYLRAIFDTDESCFPARVFSNEVTMTQFNRLSRETSPANR